MKRYPLVLCVLLSGAACNLRDGTVGQSSHSAAHGLPWDAGVAPAFRLPGEFEPVTDVLLVWEEEQAIFLTDVIAEARKQARVTLLVPAGAEQWRVEEELLLAGVEPSEIRFFEVSVESMWIRDFGPRAVRSAEGEVRLLDLEYRVRVADDAVPGAISNALWKKDVTRVPFVLDGGNLISDGRGRCVTTTLGVMESGVDLEVFRAMLRKHFGCEVTVVLPALENEPTGHVDMYVALPGPGRALVAEGREATGPEDTLELDWAAMLLTDAGFEVSRVPMPDSWDEVFRSYTNAVAVNDVVLVPVYPDAPAHEEEALAAFRAAYPGRKIVPIDASEVIELDGAVHCATQTLALADKR